MRYTFLSTTMAFVPEFYCPAHDYVSEIVQLCSISQWVVQHVTENVRSLVVRLTNVFPTSYSKGQFKLNLLKRRYLFIPTDNQFFRPVRMYSIRSKIVVKTIHNKFKICFCIQIRSKLMKAYCGDSGTCTELGLLHFLNF